MDVIVRGRSQVADFERELQAVRTIMPTTIRLMEEAKKGKASQDAVAASLVRLLRATNYNVVYMAPAFYPEYLHDKKLGMRPLAFSNRPFVHAMMAFNPGATTTIAGSRQIAKSSALASRIDMTCTLLPFSSTLYVAPRMDQVKTFADKFKEMADMNVFNKRKSRKLRRNIYYREYANRSWVKLIYCLTHANNARGNSVGALAIDEGMSFDSALEEELVQVIRRHPTPTYTIAGTALGKDSFLETKFLAGSQGTWVIQCQHCGKDNDTGELEHALAMIRPKGLCCRACSRLLRPSQGGFVHRVEKELDIRNISLRVPQIAVDDIVTDMREWNNIYLASRGPNIGKFCQEVLGIPVDEGERELTRDELKAMCEPGVFNRLNYRYVISGCDWGGSDYNPNLKMKKSNTAHVILGVKPEGGVDILHMRIYTGMAYERIIGDIISNHTMYGGTHIASDNGMGMLYNHVIRLTKSVPVGSHFIVQYGGSPHQVIAPMQTAGRVQDAYVAHKTETLTSLFRRVKNGNLRCLIPWDKAEPFLMEFMNIYRAPQENAAGFNRVVYNKHGAKTDDVVQAMNFATIALHIVTGEQLEAPAELTEKVLNTLAHEELIRQQLENFGEAQGFTDFGPEDGY